MAQSHMRQEPVMKKATRYVGLDVHAETIAVAIAEPGREGEVRSPGVIARRDPAVKAQPEYIVDRHVPRDRTQLATGARRSRSARLPIVDRRRRFHCAIYDDRPRTCREFTLGGEHCLTARRRVDLRL